MPETLAPPAPAAAPSGVRIIESAPPKPPPAPTREPRPADIAALPGDTRPGASGTARESMTRRLESKAKPIGEGSPQPVPVEPPKPAAKPAETPPPKEEPGEEPPPGAAPPPAPASDKLDPKTGKPKFNPFHELKRIQPLLQSAEAEIQRLKTSIVPEQERTALTERVTKAEARAKELEDHIRFVAYQESTEFKDTYQKPYEAAWQRATSELAEISILDPITKQPRAVTSTDILELVNMPLGTARGVANEVFGDFADDVMAHRKEIRGLFDKQNAALDEAKKNGGLRDQQRKEQWQKQQGQVKEYVSKAWKEANDEFLADPVNGEYFKPRTVAEGQQPTPEEKEWNEALERGFKLVDEAWGSNAMDPKLTPEQRAAVIKKNAAVRNRAAAFGPLKRLARRLEAKVAQLEKDLAQYAGSTPAAGGSTPNGAVKQGLSAKESFSQRLAKIAH